MKIGHGIQWSAVVREMGEIHGKPKYGVTISALPPRSLQQRKDVHAAGWRGWEATTRHREAGENLMILGPTLVGRLSLTS